MMQCFNCFFFFQAEDGIRDGRVTGVQTCALPICAARSRWTQASTSATGSYPSGWSSGRCSEKPSSRSEERRVGEEGRSRGAPDDLKKKIREAKRTRSDRREAESRYTT